MATEAVLLQATASPQILCANRRFPPERFPPGIVTKAVVLCSAITGIGAWVLGMVPAYHDV